MYFHFILFAFYFAFVAAQQAVTCANGGVATAATTEFSGVNGQMCFCGTGGSNSCDTALNTDDPEKGPFVGTIQNGKCDLSEFDDDTAGGGMFAFDGVGRDNTDFAIPSCSAPVFTPFAGFFFFGNIAIFPFSNACVCVDSVVDPCADQAASVDNNAGDCVCANGQTDVDGDGATCETIPDDTCSAPADGTCMVGELQATVNIEIEPATLCFSGGSTSTIAVEDTLTLTNVNVPQGVAPGDYTVVFVDSLDDGAVYPKMTLESVDAADGSPTTTIEWFASGDVDSCTVVSEVNAADNRKRQTGTGSPTPMPGIVVAAANGDPHLSRPDGKTFDFKGQDNAIYSFFSSPTTMINVQMGKTMTNHYIKQVGVSFRGEFEVFTLAAQRGPQSYINRINRKLNKVGGKARFPKHNIQQIIELELCQGHRVVLKKMVTKHGKRDNYFDIQVEVPGCHDDFDGALGQIYKCKYAEHKEKFVFDESMEEHYRVETLKSSFGLYNSTMATQPPCKQQIDAASTGPLSGASGHKN